MLIVYSITRTTVAVIKELKTASSSKKFLFKLELELELKLELESELEHYSTYTFKDDVIHLYL